MFATDDIIFWDNLSHYDGFEVSLDDSLVDTKDTYIIPNQQVEKVIVKPYVKTSRKKYKPETQSIVYHLDASRSQTLSLNDQKQEIKIPATTDVVYLTTTVRSESTLLIEKREFPIKIVLNNVAVVSKAAFIRFEGGSYRGLIIETLGETNSIVIDRKSNVHVEGISTLNADHLYIKGDAPLQLVTGRGGDGGKGADADFISSGRAGKPGLPGGSGIKGDLIVIHTTSTIHIKPGIGGNGGLGGSAGWYAFLGKRDGKQGPLGERGLVINSRLSYQLIGGEIIEME